MARKVPKAKNSPKIKTHPSKLDLEALAAKKKMSIKDAEIDRRKEMRRGDSAAWYAKHKKKVH